MRGGGSSDDKDQPSEDTCPSQDSVFWFAVKKQAKIQKHIAGSREFKQTNFLSLACVWVWLSS